MPGIDLAAVRAAIKDQLDNASLWISTSGGSMLELAVYAYRSSAGLQYPCAIIGYASGGDINYAASFSNDGLMSFPLQVEIRTNAADGESAEKAMDLFLGAGTGATNSVFAALWSDMTFGGTVGNGTALTCSVPQQRTDGTTTYWSATFTLNIYSRKG
jgi:hypothetical protein